MFFKKIRYFKREHAFEKNYFTAHVVKMPKSPVKCPFGHYSLVTSYYIDIFGSEDAYERRNVIGEAFVECFLICNTLKIFYHRDRKYSIMTENTA